MTYDDRITCYRTGAENPAGTMKALEAMESFILRFNEAYEHNTPDDDGAAGIYRDLVDEFLSDFRFSIIK
jgi:hypothetical protein